MFEKYFTPETLWDGLTVFQKLQKHDGQMQMRLLVDKNGSISGRCWK